VGKNWFDMNMDKTFVQLKGGDPHNFTIVDLPYYLIEAIFDKEFLLWSGVKNSSTAKRVKYIPPEVSTKGSWKKKYVLKSYLPKKNGNCGSLRF
jgi:hypothetical protein